MKNDLPNHSYWKNSKILLEETGNILQTDSKPIKFNDYIDDINQKKFISCLWNSHRKKILSDQLFRKKEILKTLSKLKLDKDKNPLNIIDDNYKETVYRPDLFLSEFSDLHHFFNENNFEIICLRREKLENIRKVIHNYLYFYANKKYDFIEI